MNVGAAQIDITPPVGVELSGYLAREQPSTGVLDPIYATCLYLEDGNHRLLWVTAELLAFDSNTVNELREWARRELSLKTHEVLFTATHTHAAPATVALTCCGTPDEAYLKRLRAMLKESASRAAKRTVKAEVVSVQKPVELAIDRRKKPSAHVDPLVTALAWKRADGSFVAAIINYAMHPVALGPVNRMISGDWCSHAAQRLASELAGSPMVAVCTGAAGNINPPRQNISHEELREFGRRVAEGLAEELARASSQLNTLRLAHRVVPMKLEKLTEQEIDARAEAFLATIPPADPLEPRIRHAVRTWQQSVRAFARLDQDPTFDIELLAVRLGPIVMVAVNGEMFSRFTQTLRDSSDAPVFVVAYSNAAFGYIPTRQAYEEGGYEVDSAHFFYNSPRPRIGSMELLAEQASELVTGVAPS